VIVEFIGTPGAGKTTLLPATIEYFQACGISARRVVDAARPFAQRTLPGALIGRLAPEPLRRPLLWQVFYQLSTAYRLKFFASRPQLIAHVLRSQRRRPIAAVERQHVRFWFFVLVGQYEFLRAHARPDEALVFDEGFIHRAVQMHASDVEEPQPAQIAAYVDLLPQPDLVIVPWAPSELCEARVYSRGLWERFQHKSRPQVAAYIANSSRIVGHAVEQIKRRGWRVVEVDNSGDDPAASAAELQGKLASIISHVREAPQARQIAQGGVS